MYSVVAPGGPLQAIFYIFLRNFQQFFLDEMLDNEYPQGHLPYVNKIA
jgi:hypothetical protein